MNETLKRAISGTVYIVLLLSCILYSKESLAILFGVFLIIAVYEFCKLANLNYFVSVPIALLLYYFLWDKNKIDIWIWTAIAVSL